MKAVLRPQPADQSSSDRFFWADGIRAAAISMVVLIHVCTTVLYSWGIVDAFSWHVANVLDSFSRMAVPLFVMVSGAFLLGKSEPAVTFFKKRMPRLLVPWLFWGTLQLLFTHDFSFVVLSQLDIQKEIMTIYVEFFWFMPMIFALYLLAPFIAPYVKQASESDYRYFFAIWFFFVSILYSLNKSEFLLLYAVHIPVWLRYFGFYVAGYYLVTRAPWVQRYLPQLSAVFVLAWAAIAVGTYRISLQKDAFSELFYGYTHFFVVCSSLSGFILLKHGFEKIRLPQRVQQLISSMSRASLGIYLSHYMVLGLLERGFAGVSLTGMSFAPVIAIPVVTLLTLGISAVVVTGLQKYVPWLVA